MCPSSDSAPAPAGAPAAAVRTNAFGTTGAGTTGGGHPDAVAERVVTLPVDLHARPAGRVARAAAGFGAKVTLVAGERSADARSVLAVMGLTATTGTEVTVRAAGADAETAAAAIAGILGSTD